MDQHAEAVLRLLLLRLFAAAAGVNGLRQVATRLYDVAVGGPGPRPSAIVRTKVIDDAVTEGAARVQQCVLLGAGYDSLGHRLPALADMPVLEVDPSGHSSREASDDQLVGTRSQPDSVRAGGLRARRPTGTAARLHGCVRLCGDVSTLDAGGAWLGSRRRRDRHQRCTGSPTAEPVDDP